MSDPASNWTFQEIPIDFDVYKALTTRLKSPTDTYNAVLRRELQLSEPCTYPNDARAWTIDGVVFPHGSEFRAKYKGRMIAGIVDDGALVVNATRYIFPSAAAVAITGTSVNGWKFWECRRPGQSDWRIIDGLRKK